MTRKSLALLALACAGAFALPGTASACQYTAWTTTVAVTPGTTLKAGQPSDTPSVPRYSGKCASLSTVLGNYAQDDSPNESGPSAKYFAQFYVFTGVTGATAVRVFEADGATPNTITVDYTGTSFVFGVPAPGVGATVNSIAANKWYMVRLGWDNGAHTMDVTVQGAGAASATTAQATALPDGQINTAKLGWISGTGTANPGIVTDAFVSQRATPPARLCRGDANNDQILGIQDRIIMTIEILAQLGGNYPNALASGQPDVNEDGIVSVQDRIGVTGRILAFASCP